MMRTCAGIKRDGGRCTTVVTNANEYCYFHDPRRAEERKRNASRAGRSKPGKELANIKHRLSNLADDVLTGAVDKGVAAVASQVLNVYVRAVALEMKVGGDEELAERMDGIEGLLAAGAEPTGWDCGASA